MLGVCDGFPLPSIDRSYAEQRFPSSSVSKSSAVPATQFRARSPPRDPLGPEHRRRAEILAPMCPNVRLALRTANDHSAAGVQRPRCHCSDIWHTSPPQVRFSDLRRATRPKTGLRRFSGRPSRRAARQTWPTSCLVQRLRSLTATCGGARPTSHGRPCSPMVRYAFRLPARSSEGFADARRHSR